MPNGIRRQTHTREANRVRNVQESQVIMAEVVDQMMPPLADALSNGDILMDKIDELKAVIVDMKKEKRDRHKKYLALHQKMVETELKREVAQDSLKVCCFSMLSLCEDLVNLGHCDWCDDWEGSRKIPRDENGEPNFDEITWVMVCEHGNPKQPSCMNYLVKDEYKDFKLPQREGTRRPCYPVSLIFYADAVSKRVCGMKDTTNIMGVMGKIAHDSIRKLSEKEQQEMINDACDDEDDKLFYDVN